jgi:hypothetical protein
MTEFRIQEARRKFKMTMSETNTNNQQKKGFGSHAAGGRLGFR